MKKIKYEDGFAAFESDRFEFESLKKIYEDIQKSGKWDKDLIKDLGPAPPEEE